ncbi:MAG: ABC transporter substrate-binding protein [Alphaproteobacteria bacterium]|nr:ABC transporter substrate-binding protein [Alphaproteobacteria bacterium]
MLAIEWAVAVTRRAFGRWAGRSNYNRAGGKLTWARALLVCLVVACPVTFHQAVAGVTVGTAAETSKNGAPNGGGSTAGDKKDLGAHYTIAVHLSSDGTRREPQAIRDFVRHRVAEINTAGGVLGRRLKVKFYDDHDNATETIANVRNTLADPRLIAVLGLWSSSRGSQVVDSIGKAGVPFISEMSVESLFKQYPTVYSLAHSVREEVDVFLALAAKKRITRIAYAGFANDLFTNSYLSHLIEARDGPGIVSTFWETDATVVADYDRAIDRLVAERAEMVVLAMGSKLGARFLSRMAKRGVRLPVFISYGSIASALKSGEGAERFGGTLFELSTGGVANLNNERTKRLARELGIELGGAGAGEATSALALGARELGYGARYADLVQLVAEAAAGGNLTNAGGGLAGGGLAGGAQAWTGATNDDIPAVRARITSGLGQLREGRRYWEGRAQYWTFNDDRATSERTTLLWRIPGQTKPVLHPAQFIRIDGRLKDVPVLYLHLDMVRMFEVDTNERRFDAEFYLTLRSHAKLDISAIDFTNAFRSNTAVKSIRWREVATYYDDVGQGLGPRRIYHVTGRFAFKPDLSKYPFDEQLVTISFQSSGTDKAFILQPPGEDVRRKSFDVEDWKLVSHYVGTTDRIITSVRGRQLEEHVIPYYNFNYTWVMRREVMDYLVRVVVPLAFILIVAYLAAFIPRHEFNATVAIQVTALLSAIALYFALNQPNSDEVTLSDKIFVCAYAIVSLMIALSIFEVRETRNERDSSRGPELTMLRGAQIYAVPVLTLAAIGWIIASAATDRSIAEGIREFVRWIMLAFSDFVRR